MCKGGNLCFLIKICLKYMFGTYQTQNLRKRTPYKPQSVEQWMTWFWDALRQQNLEYLALGQSPDLNVFERLRVDWKQAVLARKVVCCQVFGRECYWGKKKKPSFSSLSQTNTYEAYLDNYLTHHWKGFVFFCIYFIL